MRKAFGVTGVAIVTSIWLCEPGLAYTQADCDQLKKVQTDAAGREIEEKMRLDGQGNCIAEPPGAPAQKQAQPPAIRSSNNATH